MAFPYLPPALAIGVAEGGSRGTSAIGVGRRGEIESNSPSVHREGAAAGAAAVVVRAAVERIAQNALAENDSVCLFKICRGVRCYYLRGEDGEPYYLPERVQMSTLRWLSDDRFVVTSLEGKCSYIWQLLPGNRISPAF